ncbi:MAG: beta-hydroxyacyl-ACP dehydratase [Planctomycetota bacterium]|nr:beta-hydroxyacyl-ACP dehydratase [Planctomycetaceae bacterium]MDQ3330536.1 beta-hydroxyacyl-ACP dehydratase [Planctomycetota bacterium]
MNREEIQAVIPHRPPFLFLDEIVAIDDTTIHGRTFIDPKFDFFKGHYPEFPVLPGVIQCEMTFQTAAVLIAKLRATGDGRVPVVARLNNTKFRRLVRPGETVDIHVSITDKVKDVYYLTGTVGVGTAISARLDFTVTAANMT